ncbi:MAG: transposase [Gammaproteobacteria bacterium]|nr:transposase [Gammaproteobacteria bacterium]
MHAVSVAMNFWWHFPVPKVGSLREGHGICPSCNARRMVETAAHQVDHVFPKVSVRQWVLSLPKRLRYFLHNNPKVTSKVLRIFLDEIRKQLLQHYAPPEVPLGYQSDSDNPVKIGGVSFIHRFGSFLNAHPHFHCVIIEGVFIKDSDSQITFHKLSTLTEEDIQAVQERVRLRVLKSFKRSGLLEDHDVENMKTWNGGGGFSVNGTAHIHENDREGLERLIRYCARPPFALERIQQQPDGSLIYQLNKPLANDQTQLKLTSLELIDKLAALVPPPRIHRHRYYGVLAPNSPFRASVTAMAGLSLTHGSIEVQSSDHKEEETIEQEQENKPKRPPNRYLWAKLPHPAHAPYLHVGNASGSNL